MKNIQVHYDEKYEGVLFKKVTMKDLILGLTSSSEVNVPPK